ncbi:helix-turn-helix domain-containing protein [Metabacillus sp. 84]|uniref:helix-turn-helix domain-containing protein n=1 Tax=Metabacillus sp. 84 TaxID=3404705 RepID=UPI003CF9C664
MWKNKFYRTLFYSFCFIIILYSVGVFAVYYMKNMEISRVERNSSQKLLLQQVQEMMDQRIQVALNGMIQLETSEAFKDFTRFSHTELKYYHMGRVLQELQRNKTAFSNYDYDISLMLQNDDTVITSKHTMPADRFFNELHVTKEARRNFQNFAEDTSWSSYFETVFLSFNEDSDTFSFVKKYRISYEKTALFFLSFNKINLLPETEKTKNTDLMIISGKEILPLDSGEKKNSVLNRELLTVISEKNEQVPSYWKIEKDNRIIHTIGSKSLKDVQFVYAAPLNAEQSGQNSQWLAAALIPAALLLAGFGIAYPLIRHTYRPVQEMVAAIKEEDDPMAAGEDEFVLFQETAKRMREANRELSKVLKDNQVPLKMKFLWDAVHGLLPKHQILRGMEQFQLECYKGKTTVSIIEFDYSRMPLLQEGRSKLNAQAVQLLREVLGEDVPFELAELSPGRSALITAGISSGELKKKLTAAINFLDSSISRHITAAIGQEADDLASSDQSFQQASELLENRLSVEKKQILCWDDLSVKLMQTFYYPLEVEKELIHYFIQGKKEEAFQILNRILEENLDEKNLNKTALSQFVFAMAGTVNRIIQTSSRIPDEMLHLELSAIRDRETLKAEIVRTFSKASAEITSVRESSSAASRIVAYIHQHYNEDLSLQDLSDYFQLTPSYISTIFKEYSGENYKEYLNRFRIQKAKELLTDRNIKVSEAASLVGYNNVNTFIRLFKRYVGLSPGQYVKMD